MAYVNKNTVFIWQGPSQIDGEQIVLLLSGMSYSRNSKTGNILQTYILLADRLPTDAQKYGHDLSICGNCPMRHFTAKSSNGAKCYENVGHGPNQAWRSWKAGNVFPISDAQWIEIGGRMLRMGSYGDPAAVPFHVWQRLISATRSHVGYTHQWREDFALPYRGIIQASCSSLAEAKVAKAHGWHVYVNLAHETDPATADQAIAGMQCPHQTDGTKCESCGLCDGTADLWCYDHGLSWKMRSAADLDRLAHDVVSTLTV